MSRSQSPSSTSSAMSQHDKLMQFVTEAMTSVDDIARKWSAAFTKITCEEDNQNIKTLRVHFNELLLQQMLKLDNVEADDNELRNARRRVIYKIEAYLKMLELFSSQNDTYPEKVVEPEPEVVDEVEADMAMTEEASGSSETEEVKPVAVNENSTTEHKQVEDVGMQSDSESEESGSEEEQPQQRSQQQQRRPSQEEMFRMAQLQHQQEEEELLRRKRNAAIAAQREKQDRLRQHRAQQEAMERQRYGGYEESPFGSFFNNPQSRNRSNPNSYWNGLF